MTKLFGEKSADNLSLFLFMSLYSLLSLYNAHCVSSAFSEEKYKNLLSHREFAKTIKSQKHIALIATPA